MKQPSESRDGIRIEPLPVELLATRHQRRVNVKDHESFRSTINKPRDEIDDLLDELRQVEAEGGGRAKP